MNKSSVSSRREGTTFKLVAFDLDDTLLNSDKEIEPRDLEAVERCIAAGVEVVIATGRSKWTTLPVANQLGEDIPIICNTGGTTYDRSGRRIRHLTLPLDLTRAMLRHMEDAGIPARVDAGDDVFFTEDPGFTIPHLNPRIEPNLARTLETGPEQIVLWGGEASEWVVKHYSYLEGDLQLLVLPNLDEPHFVHILHPRASKGGALADYARRQGIGRGETMAFGDSLNDFSLLSYAGLGVAMPVHEPRLQLVADKVLGPEQSIADVLHEYVL